MTSIVTGYPAGDIYVQTNIRNRKLSAKFDDETSFGLICNYFATDEEQAWEFLYRHYRMLVISWLNKIAKRLLTGEEIEDMLQETLVRLWRSIQKRNKPVSELFPHLGAFLKYLKRCALSTYADSCRQQSRASKLIEKLQVTYRANDSCSLEADSMKYAKQVEGVYAWLNQQKSTEDEIRIFRYSFEYGLSPRKIVKECPDFSDVAEVYQIKKRVMKRLRRAIKNGDCVAY